MLLEDRRIVINIQNLHCEHLSRGQRGDAAVSGLDSEDMDILGFIIQG